MISDQCLLGLLDGLLHRLELLRNVQTGAPLFDHFHDAVEMTASAA